MRKTGTVVRWVDDKGFGFIAPAAGGAQAFVHIKSLPPGPRPAVGATVSYREVRDAQGRVRAEGVALAGGIDLGLPAGPGPAVKAFLVATAVLAAIAVLTRQDLLPRAVFWLYAGASLITLLLYALDKYAARAGAWRTRESTLHAWSLLGGWPGALYAQQLLRHKTSKQPFRAVFWTMVVLNLAALGALASPPGAPVRAVIAGGSERLAAAVAQLPWREWIAAADARLDTVRDAR